MAIPKFQNIRTIITDRLPILSKSRAAQPEPLNPYVRAVIIIASISLVCSLLWFRLGSLTYGNAADAEVITKQMASGWQAIIANPLNLPYKVMQRLVLYTGHDGITSLRLVSTMFAGLAAGLFYWVIRQWHNLRVALLASWLFVSSSWFLHVGRLGSPEILWLLASLAIIALLMSPKVYDRHQKPGLTLGFPITLVMLSSLLYIPGVIWLVLAGSVLQYRNFITAWQATTQIWQKVAALGGSLLVLTPLTYAFVQTPQLIRAWLGIEFSLGIGKTSKEPLMERLTLIGHNLVDTLQSLFVSSSFDAAHWLSRLPLLSVFEIVMIILGVYFYKQHIWASRTHLIAVLGVIAWLITGISGVQAISLLVPLVYLLLASGIAFIMHRWLKVFPRNPVARWLGIGMILLAVLLTSVYQTRSYFVAWRYNTDTLQAFQTKI